MKINKKLVTSTVYENVVKIVCDYIITLLLYECPFPKINLNIG